MTYNKEVVQSFQVCVVLQRVSACKYVLRTCIYVMKSLCFYKILIIPILICIGLRVGYKTLETLNGITQMLQYTNMIETTHIVAAMHFYWLMAPKQFAVYFSLCVSFELYNLSSTTVTALTSKRSYLGHRIRSISHIFT